MNTRNQTKQIKENLINQNTSLYTVEINFDEAIDAWRANKKSIGNGHYKYICLQKTKTGNQCKRESINDCEFCFQHK